MRKFVPVCLTAAAVLVGGPAIAQAAPGGSVQPAPVSWTPSIALSGTSGNGDLVRQLTPCAGNMYAAGKFSYGIKQGSTTYPRTGVFSFKATSPGTMTSFAPSINGEVDSVALSPDCSVAYLGGSFTSVNGTAVKNLAAVNTSTGAVVTGFRSSASARVNTLAMVKGHLLVGGNFVSVNNSTRKYFASLNPATGVDDGFVNLNISGNYVFTQQDGRVSGPNPTNVYNMTLSHGGSKILVTGDFTSVGGQARRQVFMLDVSGATATVTPWYSKEFNQNCNYNEAFWLQDATWSSDDSTVYTAATGFKPATDADTASGVTTGFVTSEPRGGLCDSAAAFSASVTSATPAPNYLWVQYTGCDSLYSTVADSTTVYVGGHQRYLDNPSQCDNNNNGSAVVDSGMGGLDPATGHAFTTDTNPLLGKYVRSRGTGADDEVITPAGLWIASDNGSANSLSQTCGGKAGHAGICLLPY